MKFGLFAINMGPCSDPVTAVRVAQAAEAAGFESFESQTAHLFPLVTQRLCRRLRWQRRPCGERRAENDEACEQTRL